MEKPRHPGPPPATRNEQMPEAVSVPRAALAASGRDVMTSHPLGIRADAIVITSLPQDTQANYPVFGFPLIRIYPPTANRQYLGAYALRKTGSS
jgi:hypothetical protein